MINLLIQGRLHALAAAGKGAITYVAPVTAAAAATLVLASQDSGNPAASNPAAPSAAASTIKSSAPATTSAATPSAGPSSAPASTQASVPEPGVSPIEIKVSADPWQGPAQFVVKVNGKQVGGVYTTSASFFSAQWDIIKLSTNQAASQVKSVSVSFINDASDGRGGDRNLYIDRVKVGESSYEAELGSGGYLILGPNLIGAAALFSNGTVDIATANASATAKSRSNLALVGVNFSGAEPVSADLAKWGTQAAFPTKSEMDYFAGKGMNIFRLAFNWERLQPTQGGALNKNELAKIKAVVDYATGRGIKVVLDLHNFGYGYGGLVGGPATSNAAFADFWSKMALEFRSNPNVLFGLMNEPHEQTAQVWLASANAAIKAIRSAGANSQTILVAGTYWGNAAGWVTTDNDSVVGAGIVDPAQNFAFEVHNYFDGNGSGVSANAVYQEIGVDRLRAVTEWAARNHVRLFLGEFGSATDTVSLGALDNMLTYMQQNADVWIGGTYWMASSAYTYYFSITPVNGVDAGQMRVLEKFAPRNFAG